MSESASPFDRRLPGAADALAPIRVDGGVSARFASQDGMTRIQDLRERGGYRLLTPASHGPHAEAVQINTGGGIVGGDRLRFALTADAATDVVFSTQAAERIYRSNGPDAVIDIAIDVRADARLAWLPQDTLLYSGARLRRRFEIDIAPSGEMMLVEAVTFGRIASGEEMGVGMLHDIWRVRRDGRLLFADATRLDGDIGRLLQRPAITGGARAIALVLFSGAAAVDRLATVRSLLEDARSETGASAWNGLLVVRLMAAEPAPLRADVMAIAAALSRRPMPRTWLS